MNKYRISSVIILIASALLAYFVISSELASDSPYRMKYGLDLSGGTHLVYEADLSKIQDSEVNEAMISLKQVIERRINVFGVSEPVIQVESSYVGDGAERLIIELPGITNIKDAVDMIGKTPLLEFKLVNQLKVSEYNQAVSDLVLAQASNTSSSSQTSTVAQTVNEQITAQLQKQIDGALAENRVAQLEAEAFRDTGLTGGFLKRAQLGFTAQQQAGISGEPLILIDFNDEGKALFAEITASNVGEQLAIFLDGQLLSSPVINEAITGGSAQISGNFDLQEARSLVRDLNLGALPVPIELVSTQSIGPSLGEEARQAGVRAGLIGIIGVMIFLILWYRLPGLIASLALGVYLLIMISLFKSIPIVLTSAGIAGFILSLGMAVDANVLVFERMKEEIRKGDKSIHSSIQEGFARAWSSIRDGNTTTLISALILFMAGTSLTKGFAVTLGLGVIVSIFTSMVIVRSFLHSITTEKPSKTMKFLLGSGFKK
jgi:preprotein translocase subunit SecD